MSPTSWPFTPVAEPVGPPKPRRAHNPGGQRQSVDCAQHRQALERPRDTAGKAIGPCPESVSGGSPPAPGDAAAYRLALEPHQHGHATHVGAVLYPPASASPRAGSRSRRPRLFRSAIGESAVRARLSACLARVVRRVSARFAFRWWSLPLALWAMFGSEGAACRRVDALVAVVPPDAISRRRVPSQHLFNDTGAGSAVG